MHKIIYDSPFSLKEKFGYIFVIALTNIFFTVNLWLNDKTPWSISLPVIAGVLLYYFFWLYLAEYYNTKYIRTFFHGYYLLFEIIKFSSLFVIYALSAVLQIYNIPNKYLQLFIVCTVAVILLLAYLYQIIHFIQSQQHVKKLYSPTPVNGKIFINLNKIIIVEMKKNKGTWSLFFALMIPYLVFLAAGGKIFQLDLSSLTFISAFLYFGVYWLFRLNRALYAWFFIVRKVQKETGCYVYSDGYCILKEKPGLKKKLLANDTGKK